MDVDMLPEELWCQILLDLPCKLIINICDISPKFKILCDKYDIINIRKMKGFPRESGYCRTYDISEFLYYDKSEDNYHGIYLSIDELDKLNTLSINKTRVSLFNMLNNILDKLYKLNIDLVRGDLIYFKYSGKYSNQKSYIFDGCNIVSLEYEYDNDGTLPEEFTIINNGVPINYWSNNGGVLNNDIVWFDHTTVKDQLFNNIKCMDNTLETKFIYENISYCISYMIDEDYYGNPDNDLTNHKKSEFIELLSNDGLLTYNTFSIDLLSIKIIFQMDHVNYNKNIKK